MITMTIKNRYSRKIELLYQEAIEGGYVPDSIKLPYDELLVLLKELDGLAQEGEPKALRESLANFHFVQENENESVHLSFRDEIKTHRDVESLAKCIHAGSIEMRFKDISFIVTDQSVDNVSKIR